MPSLSFRNNNPGNIRDGDFAKAQIGYAGPGEKGFAKFVSWEDGLFAMLKLLRGGRYRNLSVRDIIYIYAPPTDNNDTESYIAAVCDRARADPAKPITSPASFLDIVAAMIRHEGWIAS